MEFIAENLQDTAKFAQEFAKSLKSGDVVLLYGDLGAGKTTFVREVCRALGVAEDITSPTFTLLNEYFGSLPLYHFDMYRLKDSREAIESGLDEILRSGDGVCFVEWPEKVSSILPENCYILKISTLGENGRKFELTEAR